MHSGGILNDLELRKNENKDGKLFPVAVFETIWNYRKNENKDGKCMVHSDGIWNDLYLLCQDLWVLPPYPPLTFIFGLSGPTPVGNYYRYCIRTFIRHCRINYKDQRIAKQVLHVYTMNTCSIHELCCNDTTI